MQREVSASIVENAAIVEVVSLGDTGADGITMSGICFVDERDRILVNCEDESSKSSNYCQSLVQRRHVGRTRSRYSSLACFGGGQRLLSNGGPNRSAVVVGERWKYKLCLRESMQI